MQINSESSFIQADNPIPQSTFKSRFFGNYLDNSNIDMSSDMSQEHIQSILNQEDILKQQQQNRLRALVTHWKRNHLRDAVEKWHKQKELIIRMQKRTPTNIAKVLLKLNMRINVNIKKKLGTFFTNAKKILKEATKTQANKPELSRPPVNSEAEEKRQRKLKAVAEGVIKLNEAARQLKIKYYNSQLQTQAFAQVAQYSFNKAIISKACDALNCCYVQILEEGWLTIQKWLKYLQKTQILAGTLSLIFNQNIRNGLLALQLEAQAQSSIQSSLQSLPAPSAKPEELPFEDNRGMFKKKSEMNRPYTASILNESEGQFQQKEDRAQEIQTKSVATQNIQNYQNYSGYLHSRNYHATQHQISVSQYSEAPRTQVFSKRKQVKPSIPLPLPRFTNIKVTTTLTEDEENAPVASNCSRNSFTNTHQASRSRPLKNDDIHHDLTDFSTIYSYLDDLFFSREILNFYTLFEPARPTNQSQYSYRTSHKGSRVSRKPKHAVTGTLDVSLEAFTGTWNRLSINDRHEKCSCDHTRVPQTFHYLSPPATHEPYRHSRPKIPTHLPTHFDYYANKSPKKQLKRSASKSNEQSLLLKQRLRQIAAISSSKRQLFNVVKAGSNSSSRKGLKISSGRKEEVKSGNRKSTERKVSRAGEITSSRSRSKKEEGEYLMSFRGCQPKKKMRKQP